MEPMRVMGGSCGGYGDTGEPEGRPALSGMRGEAEYSVVCDGEGSGRAAGLETGSGEARLAALRFACPGLRYENMFEGAIAGVPRGLVARCCVASARLQGGLAARGAVSEQASTPLSEATRQKLPWQSASRAEQAQRGMSTSDWGR